MRAIPPVKELKMDTKVLFFSTAIQVLILTLPFANAYLLIEENFKSLNKETKLTFLAKKSPFTI